MAPAVGAQLQLVGDRVCHIDLPELVVDNLDSLELHEGDHGRLGGLVLDLELDVVDSSKVLDHRVLRLGEGRGELRDGDALACEGVFEYLAKDVGRGGGGSSGLGDGEPVPCGCGRVGYGLPGQVGVARLALGELLWGLRVVDEDGDERFRERHQVLLAVAFGLQEHLLGVELADGLAHEDHRELDRDGFLLSRGPRVQLDEEWVVSLVVDQCLDVGHPVGRSNVVVIC